MSIRSTKIYKSTCVNCKLERIVSQSLYSQIKLGKRVDRCMDCWRLQKIKERTISCPDCDNTRIVSDGTLCAIKKGRLLGLCTDCKIIRAKRPNLGQFQKGHEPANKGTGTQTPEDKRLYKLRWREANRDKVNEYFNDYYYKNHEASKLSRRLSRAKRRAVGEISRVIAQGLLEKSLGQCYICSTEFGDKWEIDHINPIKLGGDNSLDNLAIACRSCNRKKSSKSLEQYLKDSGGTVNNLY